MQRRILVAGLATALSSAALGAARVDPPAAGDTPLLDDPERLYISRMRTNGALSLALTRLAARKGVDDDVKEFVQFEIAEQDARADVLRMIEHPAPVSGRIKAAGDAELAALLDDKSKDLLQRLDGKQTGSPFDQEYIRLQIEGHRQAMELQIEYLSAGRSAMSVAMAKLARVAIKEHQTILSDIDAALGRG